MIAAPATIDPRNQGTIPGPGRGRTGPTSTTATIGSIAASTRMQQARLQVVRKSRIKTRGKATTPAAAK